MAGPCTKCDQPHPRCVAHKNIHAGGDPKSPIIGARPCMKWPRRGLTVCDTHGGRSPVAAAAAFRRTTEAEHRKTLGRLNIVPVDNPLTELQILAGEAKAWKEMLSGHVADLEKLRYGTDGGEQIRGEIVLFERAIDRCAAILSSIARLNIDERLVTIQQRQVDLVADAVAAVLGEMGLNAEQQQEARRGLTRRLRVVAG